MPLISDHGFGLLYMMMPACTGTRILKGLEGMHRLGFIHRDVKPANFAVFPRDHPAEAADWRVIDFGITRRFLDDDDVQISERMDFNEFRGSTTYASVHAHLKQDLSESHSAIVFNDK